KGSLVGDADAEPRRDDAFDGALDLVAGRDRGEQLKRDAAVAELRRRVAGVKLDREPGLREVIRAAARRERPRAHPRAVHRGALDREARAEEYATEVHARAPADIDETIA